jgi:hypothetical protein
MDLITRYFLRRLAISKRELQHASKDASYRDALVEVILVVLGLPSVAALSFVGISTMQWWEPVISAKWPWLSFSVGALGLWFVAVIVGHQWLGRRFKQYRDDPTPCLEFASERDERVAFWVKFSVITVCGLIIPWLGIAVDHLVR